MLAERPSPRRFISYEEVVVYSLNCKGGGRQTAGFTGNSSGMRKRELPFSAADSLLQVLFLARNCEVQHHKPTQHDGDG